MHHLTNDNLKSWRQSGGKNVGLASVNADAKKDVGTSLNPDRPKHTRTEKLGELDNTGGTAQLEVTVSVHSVSLPEWVPEGNRQTGSLLLQQ